MSDATNKIPRRWASDKELANYFGVSRDTIWRWARTGKIPAPEKLGANTTRWDFFKIQDGQAAA